MDIEWILREWFMTQVPQKKQALPLQSLWKSFVFKEWG